MNAPILVLSGIVIATSSIIYVIQSGTIQVKSPSPVSITAKSSVENEQLMQIEDRIALLEQSHTALNFQISLLTKQLEEMHELKQQLSKTASALPSVPAESEQNNAIAQALEAQDTQQRRATLNVAEALQSLGFDIGQVETIEKKREERELELLYLRNQAVREGWYGTERFNQESRKLEATNNVYLETLGTQKYDEFLYKTGQPNRIKVDGVMSGSAAEQAGIVEGDMILSYDNERIFRWDDLVSKTSEGVAEEPVLVRVKRNSQVLDIYIPRGPLGIRLGREIVNPQNS